ncbi:hypothetical protein B0H12DRAFT_1116409 [Mycena haematopus]|nr:hypothetical protein B0H12DRAFT_1116409 [Mycena haematopus]
MAFSFLSSDFFNVPNEQSLSPSPAMSGATAQHVLLCLNPPRSRLPALTNLIQSISLLFLLVISSKFLLSRWIRPCAMCPSPLYTTLQPITVPLVPTLDMALFHLVPQTLLGLPRPLCVNCLRRERRRRESRSPSLRSVSRDYVFKLSCEQSLWELKLEA